jgi:hypothetical protein
MITFHPSALLRTPDEEMRAQQYKQFVSDLRVAVQCSETSAERAEFEPAFY